MVLYCYSTVLSGNIFTGAGVGVGAEILDKGGAGAENKYFRLRNTELHSFTCCRCFVRTKCYIFSLLFVIVHI